MSCSTTLDSALKIFILLAQVCCAAFFKKASVEKKPCTFYGAGLLMDVFNNEKVRIALTIYHFYFDGPSIVKLNPFLKKAVGVFSIIV